MTHTTSVRNPTEERALKLLGSGLSAETVAAAVGVTPARITQLLSDTEFSDAVSALRYEALNKHNERDANYDSIEDTLISKLKSNIPLMIRPLEILKAIQVINAAKRRGQSAPDAIINQQNIVNVLLPTKIIQKFTVNIQNQVVQAGEQQLLTIQPNSLEQLSKSFRKEIGHENEQTGTGVVSTSS